MLSTHIAKIKRKIEQEEKGEGLVNSKPYVLLYLSSKPPMGPIILFRAIVPDLAYGIICFFFETIWYNMLYFSIKAQKNPITGLVIVKKFIIML